MKKRYFYPIWKIDKLDNELAKMEQSGLRLDKITAFRTFRFVKSQPKDVRYFTTYTISRERGMANIEQSLKEKGANKIGTFSDSIGMAEIYRITNNLDITDKTEFRNIYLQHTMMTKLLICLFLCIVSLAFFILEMCFNNSGMLFDILLTLFLVISTFFCFYNMHGLIFLKKQYKNIFL